MWAPTNYCFLYQELRFFCLFTARKKVAYCTFLKYKNDYFLLLSPHVIHSQQTASIRKCLNRSTLWKMTTASFSCCLRQQIKLYHDRFELICLTWYCTFRDVTFVHAHIAMSMLKRYIVQPYYSAVLGYLSFSYISLNVPPVALS